MLKAQTWHQTRPPLRCSPDDVTLAMLLNYQCLNFLICKIGMLLVFHSQQLGRVHVSKASSQFLLVIFALSPCFRRSVFLEMKREAAFSTLQDVLHMFLRATNLRTIYVISMTPFLSDHLSLRNCMMTIHPSQQIF